MRERPILTQSILTNALKPWLNFWVKDWKTKTSSAKKFSPNSNTTKNSKAKRIIRISSLHELLVSLLYYYYLLKVILEL